jgi:hypothetical protein
VMQHEQVMGFAIDISVKCEHLVRITDLAQEVAFARRLTTLLTSRTLSRDPLPTTPPRC